MKKIKKISAIVLVLTMVFALVPVVDAKAAENNFPTKFRVFECTGYAEQKSVVVMPDGATEIKNVKSASKNLIAGVTDYRYASVSADDTYNTYTLSFIAKKPGSYAISYDVAKFGKKIKTVKAQVYAYPCPISVKIAGAKDGYYGSKERGKLNVTAAKGNTISRIEAGIYQDVTIAGGGTRSEFVYQDVKNNSKVTLGTQGFHQKNEFGNRYTGERYVTNDSALFSETQIRVTYKDQYTKQEEQYTASFYGIAKD